MFGLSMGEIVVVFVVALVVFGPEELPRIARFLSKAARELRRASDEVRGEFDGVLGGRPRYPEQYPPPRYEMRPIVGATSPPTPETAPEPVPVPASAPVPAAAPSGTPTVGAPEPGAAANAVEPGPETPRA